VNTDNSNLGKILTLVIESINATKAFDPIELQIGIEEQASPQETPAVYVRPLYDDSYRSGGDDQPDDARAFYETTTVCEVKVWGDNLDEAERLRNAFLIAANVLFTPNATVPTGRGDYSKGLSSAERGVTITFQQGFTIPIVYETFLQALLQHVTTTPIITVSDPPDDTNPEQLPP